MEKIFQLTNVNYNYFDSEIVLDGINLAISTNESIAILGANGSGKSTLLKMFAGLIIPTSGEFIAFDEALTSARLNDNQYMLKYHQKIGFIFQDSDVQLFCNTVKEELAFGLLQLGLTTREIELRIKDICNLFNITSLLDKAPFKLSGGEKKKVAFAAVLLLNPQVIILDEPTNALDPKSQHWLIDLLQKLHQAGKTIIIATHDLNQVDKIANRGILFNEHHQIVSDLPIKELLQQQELLKEVNLIY